MSKKETKPKEDFIIRPALESLPSRAFPKRSLVYDKLIKALESKPIGIYPVEVSNKKPLTLYVALAKRLKNNKNLKIHFINRKVIVEKTS